MLDHAPRQHEPEASAFHLGLLGAEPLEGVEKPGQPIRAEAGAGVGHRDASEGGKAALLRGAEDLVANRDGAAGAVVFDGVAEQVQQHLLEPLAIGLHVAAGALARGRGDPDFEIRRQGPEQFHGLGQQPRERDGFR